MPLHGSTLVAIRQMLRVGGRTAVWTAMQYNIAMQEDTRGAYSVIASCRLDRNTCEKDSIATAFGATAHANMKRGRLRPRFGFTDGIRSGRTSERRENGTRRSLCCWDAGTMEGRYKQKFGSWKATALERMDGWTWDPRNMRSEKRLVEGALGSIEAGPEGS